MSLPPEKPVTTWLDSKPARFTVPTSVGLQLPPTLPGVGVGSYVTPQPHPASRSPQRPRPRPASALLSPGLTSSEAGVPVATGSPQPAPGGSSLPKTEPVSLPCTNAQGRDLPATAGRSPPHLPWRTAAHPQASQPGPPGRAEPFKAKFPLRRAARLMQTPENLQAAAAGGEHRAEDGRPQPVRHLPPRAELPERPEDALPDDTASRPFKCKICGRAFTTKGNLKTHFGAAPRCRPARAALLPHLPEEVHQCSWCFSSTSACTWGARSLTHRCPRLPGRHGRLVLPYDDKADTLSACDDDTWTTTPWRMTPS